MVLEWIANERMTLDLHEDSLELDANHKGGWKRQDLQGIQCPQSEDDMHEDSLELDTNDKGRWTRQDLQGI